MAAGLQALAVQDDADDNENANNNDNAAAAQPDIYLGLKVALRLGMGRSEGEDDASITYSTAGYAFQRYFGSLDPTKRFTHLIIDEIHERSVENDLLFLIARHLLRSDENFRVVLMSATPRMDIFRDYFSEFGVLTELWVGRQNFGYDEYFLEDSVFAELSGEARDSRKIIDELCNDAVEASTRGESGGIPGTLFKKQLNMIEELVAACGRGTGVLVFVSGMAEINQIMHRLKYNRDLRSIAVHADLSNDEERRALTSLYPDKVKVIVATNAAESSLTLDVDTVICTGTNNIEDYDSSHFARTILRNCWISQPSARQRAGRTGRTRHGTVFHLYTQKLHDCVFARENVPDIRKKPLHDVRCKTIDWLRQNNFFHKLLLFPPIISSQIDFLSPLTRINAL